MNVLLSAVIITFNEEKNIKRCLQSLKGVADEIVVVDSFSTDKTESICLAHGVRFVKHKFEGHIQQKNYAITQATYPHILSLDADEALDETLKQSVLEKKKNWTHDGYYMNRLTNYCGQWIYHCGWYPDRKLRLWDSRKGRWAGTNPHDRYEMLDSSSQTNRIKGNILHYSFYTIEEHKKQTIYFADIAAKSYLKQGKRFWIGNLVLNPLLKFLKSYFFQLGFLDGYYGLVISMISTKGTFLKYSNYRKLLLERT